MNQHIINIQLEVEQLFEDLDVANVILTDTGFSVVCYDLDMAGSGFDWTVPVDINADSTVSDIVSEIQDIIKSAPGVIGDLKMLKAEYPDQY